MGVSELETGTLRHLLGIRFGSSFVWFGCNHAILASIELKQYFSFPFPLCRLCYFPRDAPEKKIYIYITIFVACRLSAAGSVYYTSRVFRFSRCKNPSTCRCFYLSTAECTRGSLCRELGTPQTRQGCGAAKGKNL